MVNKIRNNIFHYKIIMNIVKRIIIIIIIIIINNNYKLYYFIVQLYTIAISQSLINLGLIMLPWQNLRTGRIECKNMVNYSVTDFISPGWCQQEQE